MFKNLSLRRKMLIATTASVMIPTLIIGLYFCFQQAKSLYENKIEDLRVIAKSVSEDIDTWISLQKATLTAISESDRIIECCRKITKKDLSQEQRSEIIQSLSESTKIINTSLPMISEVILIDCRPLSSKEKQELREYAKNYDLNPAYSIDNAVRPGEIIYTTSSSRTLKKIREDSDILWDKVHDLNSGESIFVQRKNVYTEITGEQATAEKAIDENPESASYIAKIVFDKDKKTPLAVLSFRITAGTIQSLFGHGDFYAADHNGRIIALPKKYTKNILFKILKEKRLVYEGQPDLSIFTFYMRNAKYEWTESMQAFQNYYLDSEEDEEKHQKNFNKQFKFPFKFTYEDIFGEEAVGAWSPCRETGWVIIAEENADVLFKSIYESIPVSIFITMAVGSVFLIISYCLAKDLTEPIIKLNKTVQLFASGTYSTRCDIKRKDEIGQLSEAVNEMVTKIEKTISDLRKARNEARQANSIKSRFLSNITHELRTPLNAIIGYSEVLLEDAQDRNDEYACEDINNIHIAGINLLSTINDILNISKLESGKMEILVEKFTAEDLLMELTASVKALIRKNENELKLDADPEVILQTDRVKFRQIITNLLSNSVKFTKKGTVGIDIKIWDAEKANAENYSKEYLNGPNKVMVNQEFPEDSKVIVFCVYDTGIGMGQEQYDHIFEEFTQADNSISRSYGGTGLGLALVRHFSMLLHCRLELISEPGKGSAFTIKVPYDWLNIESEIYSDGTEENFQKIKTTIKDETKTAAHS